MEYNGDQIKANVNYMSDWSGQLYYCWFLLTFGVTQSHLNANLE